MFRLENFLTFAIFFFKIPAFSLSFNDNQNYLISKISRFSLTCVCLVKNSKFKKKFKKKKIFWRHNSLTKYWLPLKNKLIIISQLRCVWIWSNFFRPVFQINQSTCRKSYNNVTMPSRFSCHISFLEKDYKSA